MTTTRRRGLFVRGGLLVAVIVAAVVVQLWVGLPDRDQLRSLLDGAGAWAVPVFVAAYVVSCLFPVGPTALLTIVGGALLGFWTAFGAVWLGAVLGASVAFLLARALGRDAFRQVSGERLRDLDARVGARGFATVLVTRLLPVLPFATLNYAFGLTSVGYRPYVLATALGILPGSALYIAVGAYGTDPGSWPFVVALAGLVLLSVLGLVQSRRSRRSAARSSSGGDR